MKQGNTLHINTILDSGASSHVFSDRSIFTQIEKYRGGIIVGNGNSIDIVGKGNININQNTIITDCFYSPGLKVNVSSVSQLIKE